jgi:GMP synthase (glutamine-hydrolysing)
VRVLAFRHVPFEGLGLIAPALKSRGIEFHYADLYRDGTELSKINQKIDGYDGLIFLGGPMSANDPLPYLKTEMNAMERAIGAGKPVLGVCLGAQLMAKTLGAAVYRNREPEIGWFDIRVTEAANSDRVFAGLLPVEKVFHWHNDTFDLPAGATLLASSDRTERQAFYYGLSAYSLQFHLEVTPRMIVNWYQEGQNCGGEVCIAPYPWRNRLRLNQVAGQVFGKWCDLLSPRPI